VTRVGSWAARLIAAGVLLWGIGTALVAPELPRATAALAILAFAATLWRPSLALVALAVFSPAGLLLAASPARAAELLAWAFLAGWLLRRTFTKARLKPGTTYGVATYGVAMPAVLYAACAAASWISLMVGRAAGVDASAIGAYLVHAVTPQFLVFSSVETPTWTMVQAITGVAVYLASMAVAREDPALPRRIAWAVVAAMTVLGVVTCIDVVRQWSGYQYDLDFLRRYVRGERFTYHLADLNAAGSQYVLAAGIALGLALERTQRWPWIVLLALMVPAFWLTGSRTAVVALAGSVAAIAAVRRKAEWRFTRPQVTVATAAVMVVVLAAVALAAFGSDERGSAGRALRLRTQFSQTTARMLASAPVFGVGVGQYFERSSEFMPAALRDLYGAENAHNYFAQQFAELGLIGGLLFAWLVAAALVVGWRRARAPGRDPAILGLFAGCTGFLLTCITGHPFLVSEAALPLWIALGVLVAGGDVTAPSRRGIIAAVVAVLLVVNVGRGVMAYRATNVMPPESGFDSAARSDDGRTFRWTSPHVVTYVPNGPGFLAMTMRAPDVDGGPFVVETAVAGRVVDRRELPRGRWVTVEIPVRDPTASGFRRVDVRVRPYWTEQRPLGQRTAPVDVALGVMMAELRWVKATA
jgi:O-antigen ligase